MSPGLRPRHVNKKLSKRAVQAILPTQVVSDTVKKGRIGHTLTISSFSVLRSTGQVDYKVLLDLTKLCGLNHSTSMQKIVTLLCAAISEFANFLHDF